MNTTELTDRRILRNDPLDPPIKILEEYPLTTTQTDVVNGARNAIEDILTYSNHIVEGATGGDSSVGISTRKDDRIFAVVGPCSIHDPKAALEYAEELAKLKKEFESEVVLVMRTYFAKPRTIVGWKGFLYDPDLNGENNIGKGLREARRLLLQIVDKGVPCSMEHLDNVTPQYFDDVLSWAAIGARTSESQIHRELASGISSPVGFKNGTGGSIQLAVQASQSASQPHRFLGCDKNGRVSSVETLGNPHVHVILRGGSRGPNYEKVHVEEAETLLTKAERTPNIVIDCSHGNSQKDHKRQVNVVESIYQQVAEGNQSICGVMIESNLVEGRQNIGDKPLVYGKSITDACVHLEDTREMLRILQKAVLKRRELNRSTTASIAESSDCSERLVV